MKKHGLLLLLSGSLLCLAACGGKSSSQPIPTPTPSSSTGTSSSSTGSSSTGTSTGSTSTGTSTGTSTSTSTSTEPQPTPELANGVFTYQYENNDVRTEILGKLEKYLVETKLTGLTLYGDGGYVMYNPIVQKGTNQYIPGYGFGILGEGQLLGDLEGEVNPEWKRYYHIYESDDPMQINYMNDKGAVVGDLIGYVNAAYFDTQMSEWKDSYDWVGDLSTEDRPIPVNANELGFADTYRIPVKVGSALKYTTNSDKIAAFNNREVQLEDYITPYKIYYTQAFGMARGSENLSGTGSIAGAKAYWDGSENGFNADLWENIGIKGVEEDGKSYLEFTFNQACTTFYAMYYLASSMFAPVPAEFITAIGGGDFAQGVKNWGTFTEDGQSPMDHWLCTGPYAFERWDEGQQIVFKKNPNYADRGRYKIQGIHCNILTAAKEDSEAGFKEFLANKLHASGIPATQLGQYRDDPRTTMTSDSSSYKLNINVCDAETWIKLFGVNGSITQTAPENYWNVKPAMSNKDFVNGLNYCLDRKTLANYLGRTPTGNFFGSAYMSDPENGVSYNSTDAHKEAIASMRQGTDEYGYSLEAAKASFEKAANDMIAAGLYDVGDEIEIEIAWQTQAQIDREGAMIAGFMTKAFNTDENPLTLKVNNWVGSTWSDVYYYKMMLGQFDLGFGSISGNTLDPLNFLEALKSDNSSGFTLNWGIDTNSTDPENLIEFDNKLWSFDALWTAADRGAYILDGANAPLYDFDLEVAMYRNADGNLIVEGKAREVLIEDDEENILAMSMLYSIVLYGQTGDAYHETELTDCWLGGGNLVVEENEDEYWNVKWTAEFDKDVVAPYEADTDRLGFDMYFASSLLGSKLALAYCGSIEILPGSIPAIDLVD